MKVFISYHRKDSKQKERLQELLKSNNISFYSVPDNHNFDGKNHQTIMTMLASEISKCDVVICVIGKETYTRPHVDHELHFAFKGDAGVRKGVVAVMLENRSDSKKNIEKKTFPERLIDNLNYVVVEQYASIADKLVEAIKKAQVNRKDKMLQTSHSSPVMQLRAGNYYDM